MPNSLKNLQKELRGLSNSPKAKILQRFFKTAPGEYGYGDKFLGVIVPEQRKIAKKYYSITSLKEIEQLLHSPFHEERLTALLILVLKYEQSKSAEKKKIFRIYLKNLRHINNWDLVDLSAPNIVGDYLFDKDKKILIKLVKSNHLWSKRVAILATYYFIKQGDCAWTLKISKILLDDKHDLIHKAVGWMLREVGKNCGQQIEKEFLDQYGAQMPRTMLRYAIEKFSPSERKKYLS
jgi:3-methyladenine DNA glycosylase AlkD